MLNKEYEIKNNSFYKDIQIIVLEFKYNEEMKKVCEKAGIAASWLCGYIVIPEDANIKTINYEDIDDGSCVNGGLTYGRYGLGAQNEIIPKSKFVLGWDYAHFWNKDTIVQTVIEEAQNLIDHLIESGFLNR